MNLTLKSDTFSIDFDFPAQFVNSALLTFVQCQTVRHDEIDNLVIRAIRNPQPVTKLQQANHSGAPDDSTDESNMTPSVIEPHVKEAVPACDSTVTESMEDYGFSKTRRPERNSSVARMFGERHGVIVPKRRPTVTTRMATQVFSLSNAASAAMNTLSAPKLR